MAGVADAPHAAAPLELRLASQRAAGLRDLDARVSRRHGPRDVPVPLWEGSRCWDPGDYMYMHMHMYMYMYM